MKKVDYVALYFADFLNAVDERPAIVVGAYWLALLNYWNKECNGLENDDLRLRLMCRCEPEEWEIVKPQIFQSDSCFGPAFFQLAEDGRWHQKRAREEYMKSDDRIKKAVKAINKRWEKENEEKEKRHSPSPPPPPRMVKA